MSTEREDNGPMIVVVTGCNGKLGCAVSELLLATGHVVVGIDAAYKQGRPHSVLIESLLDPHAIHRAFDAAPGDVEAVVHLANHTNSLAAPPETVLRENLAMNTSVFLAASNRGVRRIVFASSVQAMLGGYEADGSWSERLPERLPIDESVPCNPRNVYGLSKVLSEQMLEHLADAVQCGSGARPVSAVSLRLPYILDQGSFDRHVHQEGPATFRWSGAEAFAYVALADAAEAIASALGAPIEGHEAIWCAAPDARTAETPTELIDRFYADVPGAEAARNCDRLVDCSKAHRLLGWTASRVIRDERTRCEHG